MFAPSRQSHMEHISPRMSLGLVMARPQPSQRTTSAPLAGLSLAAGAAHETSSSDRERKVKKAFIRSLYGPASHVQATKA